MTASMKQEGVWEVVRQDFCDGRIAYEVWSVEPYAFLFAIYEDLTPAAKQIAESIVRDHNAAPDLLEAATNTFFALGHMGANADVHHPLRHEWETLRAAIAKATKAEGA